jgi:asparagine synthase (glutamine-hydrolysing)
MCGVFGIVFKSEPMPIPLRQAVQIIRHRGPDDSGYMLWSKVSGIRILADEDTSGDSVDFHQLDSYRDSDSFQLAFGHRRLSILDLSPHGHQPMVFKNLTVCYNGEVYNYIEVREKLKNLGRVFHTQSDTEVILQAWDEWGENCLSEFNGMFAFLLFDSQSQKLYAVRDRFGVKPLYYFENQNFLSFASEVKQLRLLPDYKFELEEKIAYEYLRYGFLDHSEDTFESQIKQVLPGHILCFDLNSGDLVRKPWYTLQPKKFKGTFEEAQNKFKEILKDAVKLRLRSDVPVGSALSGGLDSSAVVCLMDELLKENPNSGLTLHTVTSSSKIAQFDETKYAQIVNNKVGAISHQVFPDFDMLKSDLESLIWHMDYPFGSTSQFAQWKVFEGAKNAGLIVMIDGQGADEQLAGYGGNDLFLYSGLWKNLRLSRLISESIAYKQNFGNPPKGFLLGGLINLLPKPIQNLLPRNFRFSYGSRQSWLKHGSRNDFDWKAEGLNQNLINQIKIAPLPALLRYEDRNSMAFSVESRTPFMDYRLIEFCLGLPEEFVYRHGERKTILRSSLRGIVPDEILDRKDKMGFVSNEEYWVKNEGKNWFKNLITQQDQDLMENFFHPGEVEKYIDTLQNSAIPFEYDAWRILNFKLWYNQMKKGKHLEQYNFTN